VHAGKLYAVTFKVGIISCVHIICTVQYYSCVHIICTVHWSSIIAVYILRVQSTEVLSFCLGSQVSRHSAG